MAISGLWWGGLWWTLVDFGGLWWTLVDLAGLGWTWLDSAACSEVGQSVLAQCPSPWTDLVPPCIRVQVRHVRGTCSSMMSSTSTCTCVSRYLVFFLCPLFFSKEKRLLIHQTDQSAEAHAQHLHLATPLCHSSTGLQ